MALTETIRGMGKVKAGAMVLATLLMIGFFVMLAFRMSASGMVPLYTNLTLDDSSKIVAELEKSGTPYELVTGGTQIMVPADRVLRLRMTMAEMNIPAGGSLVGYEIFDRSESFGTSSFVMNINMMRALEGELARTIGSISNVDSARVHLVLPKRELFTRDKDKPSASVTIKMRGGHSLEKAEVAAVTHLVASSVPGLESSKVTIVDSNGRLLARGDGTEDMGASNAAENRTAYETRIQQTLTDMLEKVVGPGKVQVQVTADMNFDRIVTNTEKFDPDGQVARSTQSTSNRDSEQDKAAGETVGVQANLPGSNKGADTGNSTNHVTEKSDETTNYEISKTVQNHIQDGGTVNKLSVAVLVDGVYTPSADGKPTYAPRSEDELKQIKSLINTAIGYDEKRGDNVEVVNMKFLAADEINGEPSFFEKFKLEMQSIVQTLIIAVVAILAILLVLRPAVMYLLRQAQSPSDRVAGDLAALEGPAGGGARLAAPGGNSGAGGGAALTRQESELMIDVANIKGGMKSSSMKKINEIVDKYPEETMGVLRQWILKQS